MSRRRSHLKLPQLRGNHFHRCDHTSDDSHDATLALLEIPRASDVPPRLVLVEFQGALPNSLFESRGRTLLYWGRDFLDGFSQLMDWHFFRYHAPMGQKVASLIADCRRPVETTFLLVAGLQEYSKDELSERRLAWWSSTLSLGAGFRVVRFDDISREARHWLEACGKWKPDGPPAVTGRVGQKGSRFPTGTAEPRNNKAALTGRPLVVSAAGAGAGA